MLLIDDGNEEKQIPLNQLQLGDTVIVHTGSMIPVDGVIVDGNAMINQATITGEPLAVKKETEDIVYPFDNFERDYVLKTAACLEEHFPHSVARAIVKKAEEEKLDHKEEHADVQYVVAHGIASSINNEKALIGSHHFVFEDEKVKLLKRHKDLIEKESKGYSVIYLAVGGEPAGFICIEDPVRKEAKSIIAALKETEIKNVIMLTGDGEKTAAKVCEELNIDKYYSQVLPEDKAEIIENLKKDGHVVVMVGDGVNDSPALAAANVSIAMKDGSDIAREIADISLMNSDLSQIITARILGQKLMKKISNHTMKMMIQFRSIFNV